MTRRPKATAFLAALLAVGGIALVPTPASAWEKLGCFTGQPGDWHYDGGHGTWRGHGNGSPVEIWYTNRELSTGNDEKIRHIHDANVQEWNEVVGKWARMFSVKIEGDSYLPGTAESDYDFDAYYAGSHIPPGWFTAKCDGSSSDARRHFVAGNDVRLNQTYMDEYFANDEYFMVAYYSNHEIGHAFGLGHENDIPCDGTTANVVMRWQLCSPYFSPAPDDYDGVRAQYPLTTPPTPFSIDCPQPVGATCHAVLPR